ncbi:hypothetical protein L3i20_v236660 [Paenibacillus sp. L3-i20]|nr:hypothetical protein L3i20_v236660 [Paenibacillus sp. L3-i20]
MNNNQELINRAYLTTTSGYCRSCRESELFDRYQVTTKHVITAETETSVIAICQGCTWEYEVKT